MPDRSIGSPAFPGNLGRGFPFPMIDPFARSIQVKSMARKGNSSSSRPKAVAYLRTSPAANVGTDRDSERRQRQAIEAFAKQAGYECGGVLRRCRDRPPVATFKPSIVGLLAWVGCIA